MTGELDSAEVFLFRTNVLLSDGVGPAVVSKHLVGQADHAVPFNVANLETGFTDTGSTVLLLIV